jgi:hypothetical protein
MEIKMMHRVVCAAIWVKDGMVHPQQPKNIESGYVICGANHAACLYIRSLIPDQRLIVHEDGFLTNTNLFVNRIDGLHIERLNNPDISLHCPHIGLMSEDMYQEKI